MDFYGYTIPLEWILIGCFGFCFLSLIFGISALSVAKATRKRMKRLLRDTSGRDVVEVVANYYDKCIAAVDEFRDAKERLGKLEQEDKACIKKVGAIRYNAFSDAGGNLSFAAALLDENDNGFVINGVYGRQQTSTYLKPITEGTSQYELSEEEIEALRTAKINYEKLTKKN